MTEEEKKKKSVKKKTSTKDIKGDDGKKKGAKSPSSKKSSASISKKGESPTASRADLHSDERGPDREKDKAGEESQPPLNPPPPSNYPGFGFGRGPGLSGAPGYESLGPLGVQRPTRTLGSPPPLCSHHGQPLKYYCEACDAPTCNDCHSLGPHNSELHRIASLQDAFGQRYQYLSGGAYRALLEKRDKLLAQLDKLDYRIGEIRTVAGIVERDIKTEYAGLLERLQSAEGAKQAVLQHDMAEVQKDIERIDSITAVLDQYLHGELRGDYLGFLLEFRRVHEYLEYALTKPFKTRIDVVPNDLPRELTERRQLLARAEQSEGLLKLKDDIIWNLIQEKKKLSRMAEVDLDKATQEEWNKWAGLIDKYYEELLKYELVCAFCGCFLDDISVNGKCSHNLDDMKLQLSLTAPIAERKFTVEEPPLEHRGTGRHFFAKPLKPSAEQGLLAKVLANPRASEAFNAIKASDRQVLAELRRALSDADREGREEVSLSEFQRLLSGLFKLGEEGIVQLAAVLTNPMTKRVAYKQFLAQLEPASPLRRRPGPQGQDLPSRSLPPFADRVQELSKERPHEVAATGKGDPWQSLIGNIRKLGLTKDNIVQKFQIYDKDNAGMWNCLIVGTVTNDQFTLVMSDIGFPITNIEIKAFIHELNPDPTHNTLLDYRPLINKIFD